MRSVQGSLALLAATASALHLPSLAVHKGVHIRDDGGSYDGRDGPVAPDTAKNCNFYYTTEDPTENCDYIEQGSGISHKDFVAWNPSVKNDCSGINVGWAYCVHVDPSKTAPAPAPSSSSNPSPTASQPSPTDTPSPIQDGIVDGCKAWYKAKSGDTCDAITRKNGLSVQQFESWNPALGDDCQGLWANFYYCVAGPGWTPSTKPTSPSAPRSPATQDPNPNPAPTPVQDGVIDTCSKWYKAKGGDNCDGIAKKNGISSKDFKGWNPAVEEDCSGLWANYNYCVGVPGRGGEVIAPAKPTPEVPAGPPVQDGMVQDCQTVYTAKKGDSCATIVKQYGNLDVPTFIKWNPAVGEECYNIWANYGYCVGTKDKPATKPSAKPPAAPTSPDTPSGCSKPHPDPTQPGALCECKKWYKVARGDSCYNIARKFGVKEDDLSRWNPGSNCELWLNYNVCVSA